MIKDTYFYLLENPSIRQLGLLSYDIEYQTVLFDVSVYERSRRRTFRNRDEAYSDWLLKGRADGAEWASGKDTVLKIVLKAKDEPELIDAWVKHHARIVGYENIIILDCGSTDEDYLEKLDKYKDKLLVLAYRKFYNSMHAVHQNSSFFSFLSKQARFLTILDADEFLTGKLYNEISSLFVKQILLNSSNPVMYGIWLNCSLKEPLTAKELPNDIDLIVDTSSEMIKDGAVAGKAIVDTSKLFSLDHLGHNLHTSKSVDLAGAHAFGEIFVLHLKSIGVDVEKRRVLSHLVGKGAFEEKDLNDYVKKAQDLLSGDEPDPGVKKYLGELMKLEAREKETWNIEIHKETLRNPFLGEANKLDTLNHNIDNFDFFSLIQQRKSKFR